MILEKFEKENTDDIQEYYDENGYVIIKNLISEELIDKYLNSINSLLERTFPIIWSTQDTHRHIFLRKNSENLLEHSLQNPHGLCWSKSFRNSVLDIVANEATYNILKCFYGSSDISLWQTMYFDKSTGTVGHQDSYYLDTIPNGSLVGVWYALEDINYDGGPFWIIPKSHNSLIYENDPSVERYVDHDDYIKSMSEYLEDKKLNEDIKPMLLKKGDCLFWHPFLVHGALDNLDSKISRKSLTAHYFPSNFQIKFHPNSMNSQKIKDFPIRVTGYPSKLSSIKEMVKSYLNISKQIFNKDAKMDMRSKSYKKS